MREIRHPVMTQLGSYHLLALPRHTIGSRRATGQSSRGGMGTIGNLYRRPQRRSILSNNQTSDSECPASPKLMTTQKYNYIVNVPCGRRTILKQDRERGLLLFSFPFKKQGSCNVKCSPPDTHACLLILNTDLKKKRHWQSQETESPKNTRNARVADACC